MDVISILKKTQEVEKLKLRISFIDYKKKGKNELLGKEIILFK